MNHRSQTWETEQCPSCLQLYSYEIQYRCIECDEPVCAHCVATISTQWACLSCKEESGASASHVEG